MATDENDFRYNGINVNLLFLVRIYCAINNEKINKCRAHRTI